MLKELVPENEFQATSRDDLVQRIKHCVKNVDVQVKKMKNWVPQKRQEKIAGPKLVPNSGPTSFCYISSFF